MEIVRDDVARASAAAVVDSACGEVRVAAEVKSTQFLNGECKIICKVAA